jgi:hypothetical protein
MARKETPEGVIPFSYDALIPMPEELRGTMSPNNDEEEAKRLQEEYGYSNWYDWANDKWGCKWDNGVNHVKHDCTDTFAQFEFHSPWAPPVQIYEFLFKNFPDVSISWFYDEPGMAFCGYLERDYKVDFEDAKGP